MDDIQLAAMVASKTIEYQDKTAFEKAAARVLAWLKQQREAQRQEYLASTSPDKP